MLTLPKLILPAILGLALWAWMAVGGLDGYWLAVRTLHLHSPWQIAPFVIFFALLALLILPLGIVGWLDLTGRSEPGNPAPQNPATRI
jgi:hypothetical protein